MSVATRDEIHVGDKFNRWTVKDVGNRKKAGHKAALCVCECGTEREVDIRHLLNGQSASCGCWKRELTAKLARSRAKLHVQLGQVFTRLTVVEPEVYVDGHRRVKCQCECGAMCYPLHTRLLNGIVKSCGCWSRDHAEDRKKTHGQSASKLYKVWSSMKDRCSNKKSRSYRNYGARGISVCDEWQTVEAFLKWATEHGYRHGLTIDRIDNDGNYEPSNCRFVTYQQNNTNRRQGATGISGYVGVSRSRRKWTAHISCDNKMVYLGMHVCPTVAALARDKYIVAHRLPHRLAILSDSAR